jgi:hypothetical protein
MPDHHRAVIRPWPWSVRITRERIYIERHRYIGDVGVLTEPQLHLRTVALDPDFKKPLEVPQLSHLIAGQQGSTKGPELGLS